MSYILEALKKAQAERQLGNAPTIHAIPLQAAPAERAVTRRLPMYVTLAICAALLAGAGMYWWRQPGPVAPVVVVQAASPPPIVVAAPAPPVAAPVQVPQTVRAAPLVTPAPAPVAVTPPLAPVARAPAPDPAASQALDESLPYMRDLPEQQRSSLPQVTFGGYMYSKNPADRLLLIDKVLRHEGEEVAPGLVLEKLLPRAAVMNYRGTRYRVAY